jgi:hypothetical protein
MSNKDKSYQWVTLSTCAQQDLPGQRIPYCFLSIPGDITGSTGMRDSEVNWDEWCRGLMWRSDGVPAKHPTFALVLLNDTNRNRLMNRGRYAITSDDVVDADMTSEEFLKSWDDSKGKMKFLKALNFSVGSIRGTDQYWGARQREFIAINHFLSYTEDKEPHVFHTESLAEYHDPFLRRILSKYVTKVESEEEGRAILESDLAFYIAVGNYKTVVTQYFCCKQETWLSDFLTPVYGVVHNTGAREFAKGRGAIHYHGLGVTNNTKMDATLDESLTSWAMTLNDAIKTLDEFILAESGEMALRVQSPHEALEARKAFLLKTTEGQKIWKTYQETIHEAQQVATVGICDTFKDCLGLTAYHPGKALEE